MKLGVLSIALLLACSGAVLAQSDDDNWEKAENARPSLKAARKLVRDRCVSEVRAQTPRPSRDDGRNAVLVCITKAAYDCAKSAQDQKVQKAKRMEFLDACLRGDKKS